jgi:hypothetical protein
MTTRRVSSAVLGTVLTLLVGASTALPASAQVAATPKTQEVPSNTWRQPNPNGFYDALGTWVYVAPQPQTGAGQLSGGNYEYPVTFVFDHLRVGELTLATGPSGNVARVSLTDLVNGPTLSTQIAYDWSPGRFYFLYTQHLGGDEWGAWVMDWAAGTWTYIGSLHTPTAWGSMVNVGLTSARWAPTAARPTTCSGYARTDAYFFPTLEYVGSQYTVGTADGQSVTQGDCPSQTETLPNGWIHYRLGADPAG